MCLQFNKGCAIHVYSPFRNVYNIEEVSAMIKNLSVNNFTVFKKASFSFGKCINVFIGKNGAGKTHILKFLYAVETMLRSYQANNDGIARRASADELSNLKNIFKVEYVAELINLKYRNKVTVIKNRKQVRNEQGNLYELTSKDLSSIKSNNTISCVSDADLTEYGINLSYDGVIIDSCRLKNNLRINSSVNLPEALFLPTHELLTLYPNYLSLSKKYHLPYDQTYDDTIATLGLPYEKSVPPEYESIVKILENAIEGRIFLRNEKFFFHPNSAKEGQDLDVNMTAEGWRKLGMVLQLLKNGGLHKGMTLFWDEPEANLNPHLICIMAKVIVTLSLLGIQVFLTTHSLFFLREIDMLTKKESSLKKGNVRFFNFVGNGIIEQGDTPEELGDILLLDESLSQSDRILAMED